jgi:hypothetical protein
MADQPKMATMAQRVLQYMSTGYTKARQGNYACRVYDEFMYIQFY